jgi:hypothetical protein
MRLKHTVTVAGSVPVRWVAVRYPSPNTETAIGAELSSGNSNTRESTRTLPANTPLSQPYWLRTKGTTGLFAVDDPSLIGRPENPPVVPVKQVFKVGDETLVFDDEPVQVTKVADKPEVRQRLQAIPPASLDYVDELELFAPGGKRTADVEITAARPATSGIVRLEAPEGWKVSPATQSFKLAKAGDKSRVKFDVTAPAKAASGSIQAVAEIGGKRFANRHIEIRYDHIPPQLLQPATTLKAVSLELAVRGKKVGYLPGAGDSVAASLKQMGCEVTELKPEDLTAVKLSGFDSVVTGIRIFDTHRDLAQRLPALFSFVENGGNVIMQYNRVDGMANAPLTLRISQSRVTDETAPVTFLAPDHPALTTPNKISAADFEGWVQERGVYFPGQWDERFVPILACNDPGEQPLKSGLLVAKYGKGYFVYTGLAFFRELPDGVPGAHRLFANLISLGK